jgi:hypothetical protein
MIELTSRTSGRDPVLGLEIVLGDGGDRLDELGAGRVLAGREPRPAADLGKDVRPGRNCERDVEAGRQPELVDRLDIGRIRDGNTEQVALDRVWEGLDPLQDAGRQQIAGLV